MLTRRPHHDVVVVMAVMREGAVDGGTETAKRRGNGSVRRAQRGHGALDVQAGEKQSQPDGADMKCDAPSHPPLFLWVLMSTLQHSYH